jgi:hypothetical protein
MAEIPRIGVHEAHERVMAGRALLVCGYENEERCNKFMLKSAMSLARFLSLLPSLPRDREIIFY